jgi:hypothetical protein
MQHFETDFNPSDATFDTWRLAIVQQGQNLIHVVADFAPSGEEHHPHHWK